MIFSHAEVSVPEHTQVTEPDRVCSYLYSNDWTLKRRAANTYIELYLTCPRCITGRLPLLSVSSDANLFGIVFLFAWVWIVRMSVAAMLAQAKNDFNLEF